MSRAASGARPTAKTRAQTPTGGRTRAAQPSSPRPRSSSAPKAAGKAARGAKRATGTAAPAGAAPTNASSPTSEQADDDGASAGAGTAVPVEARALALWSRAAPGAAAKLYASRINRLFGWSHSPAALLFNTKPADLVVHIDASHDHATLSALAIGRGVTVVAIKRPNSRVALLDVVPSVKVAMGDQMTLRAPPHVLVALATLKAGRPVLAPRHARNALAPIVRAERQTMMAAAEALQKRLTPLMRTRAEESRLHARAQHMAARLQAVWRGVQLRRSTAGLLELHRSLRKAAKLRSRRLLASMLRAQHDAPICTAACFAPSSEEVRAEDAMKRRAWESEHAALAMQYAQYAAMARSHTTTVNKFVAAAPEARSSKMVKKVLPWSPLGVLLAPSLELTTTIDKRGNNATVGALRLPTDTLSVTRLRVNNRSIAAPKNSTSLNTTKVLDGDQLVLRGLPHHIAAVCDPKNGRLVLCPPKDRKEDLGARLRRERQSLHTFAERLARGLQRAGRARLALREGHRRSHAALVIQIEWAGHVAIKLSQQLTARRKEMEAARAAASTRPSSMVRGAESGSRPTEVAERASIPPEGTASGTTSEVSTSIGTAAASREASALAAMAAGAIELGYTQDEAGAPRTTVVPGSSQEPRDGTALSCSSSSQPTNATAHLGAPIVPTAAPGALKKSAMSSDGELVASESEAATTASRSSGSPLPTGAEDGADVLEDGVPCAHASADGVGEDVIADEAANLLAEVLGRRPRTETPQGKVKVEPSTPQWQLPSLQGRAAGVPKI